MATAFQLAASLLLALMQEPPTYTAPLEVLKTRHAAVQVMVNGKGPVRLVLDTGSPITFVRAGAALRTGLISEAEATGYSLGGLRTMKQVNSVSVAGAEVKDLSVIILDHPTIELIGRFTGGLDGILGFSFFSRFRTVIDYVAGTVSFTPTDYAPEEVLGSIMRRVFLGNADRVIAPPALWGMAIDGVLEGRGVVIKKVYRGGPAESAGLREGDRILTLDDRWTDSVHELYQAAAGVPAGETVSVLIQRGHDRLELHVTPVKGI
jgi:hypothetical protein